MFRGENNWQRTVFNKGLFLFVVMNFQVLLPQIWLVRLFVLSAATCVRFSIELMQSSWSSAACQFKG
jgi:hypothetical protein